MGIVESVHTLQAGTINQNKQSNPLSLGDVFGGSTKDIKGGNEELESEKQIFLPRGWVLNSLRCHVNSALRLCRC